jgi:UDP-N-acetylglucosamine 2-epimerase (non-hydrolysing)
LKVLLVAGARPNFMKIAPIYREALRHPEVNCRIVHTGQHYDREMSQAFFDDLGLPAPHRFLNAGSGSHAEQTARIMVAFEQVCLEEKPDAVVVVGDVNSTLACSIVAKKLWIRVAHVEAGLRSFDLAMPEEINRMVTDAISDDFFVTEESGVANLLREGKSRESIHFVGHVMIDNLLYEAKRLEGVDPASFAAHGWKDRPYGFVTLHRPSNVDSPEAFGEVASALEEISRELRLLFPVHPRTRGRLAEFGIPLGDNVVLLPPLGFQESLFLWKDAAVVLTDSGGLQEETTALGVPCVTLRANTERPITVEMGTNVLAGNKKAGILAAYRTARDGRRVGRVPPLWDGKASERIWEVILGKSCQPSAVSGQLESKA